MLSCAVLVLCTWYCRLVGVFRCRFVCGGLCGCRFLFDLGDVVLCLKLLVFVCWFVVDFGWVVVVLRFDWISINNVVHVVFSYRFYICFVV